MFIDALEYLPLISRAASLNTFNNITTFSPKPIVDNKAL